jgi:hypothetical protein
MELAKTIAPHCKIEFTGIRPGEKVHEVLISVDEAWHSLELPDMFVIRPSHPWWRIENWHSGKKLPDGFCYVSNTNARVLTAEELSKLIEASSGRDEEVGDLRRPASQAKTAALPGPSSQGIDSGMPHSSLVCS